MSENGRKCEIKSFTCADQSLNIMNVSVVKSSCRESDCGLLQTSLHPPVVSHKVFKDSINDISDAEVSLKHHMGICYRLQKSPQQGWL